MLAGRPGLRFALEALFLILLAVGAGLADLRPLVIVLVMAGAWVLVGLVEFTAGGAPAPLSYFLPAESAPREEEDDERVEWPLPEERTVVAPPEQRPPPEPEPAPEPEPVAEEPEEQEPAPVPGAWPRARAEPGGERTEGTGAGAGAGAPARARAAAPGGGATPAGAGA